MRTSHSLHSNKRQGFIVNKSLEKNIQIKERTLSVEIPIPAHPLPFQKDIEAVKATFKNPNKLTVRKHKIPQDVQKVDQMVYYNSDVYQPNHKSPIKFVEQMQKTLKIKKSPENITTKPTLSKIEQSILQQKDVIVKNIHDGFDLQRYREVYRLLKNIIESISINEIQVLKDIRIYLNFVCRNDIDDATGLKFIPNKRDLLKQSFAVERQAIVIVCFAISINIFEKLKNYCSNILKYVFENYLVILNQLIQQDGYVSGLLHTENKQYLKMKGFEFIRTTNELISGLVHKIIKNDPLFADEFCKILQSYSTHSVKTQFYYILTFFAFYLHALRASHKIPFLSTAPGPFIFEKSLFQYTLAIDFINVFMNQGLLVKRKQRKQNLSLRPYSMYFLHQMAKYYEIISFSDYMPIECSKLISKIDQKRVIKHKLFKYHIDHQNRKKDTSKIGRDLNKIILLDCVEDLTGSNLFLINPYKGESQDAVLAQICPLLALIAVKKLPVQQSLKKIKQSMTKNWALGIKHINCGLQL